MKKLLILACAALSLDSGDSSLIVHEWGTFTSVSGSDGAALDWRPLAGPDDLPSFVYGPGNSRGQHRRDVNFKLFNLAKVRMETPVVYFYADRPTEVSAKVEFPLGQLTEWYPAAKESRRSLDWGRFMVEPRAREEFLKEPAPSHYYPARETDASPVRVGKETEKLLFYRGLGTFALPVQVTLQGTRVTVKNAGPDALSRVFVFESAEGRTGMRILENLKGEATVERPELTRGNEAILKELEQTLVGQGLYVKEARAMIKTWKDTWFEEGLRVFYVVPRSLTDSLLPLTITPKPAQLVRVLVARAEVITPESEREVLAAVDLLSDPARRSEAERTFAKFGRFCEPILRRTLLSASDPAVKLRIESVLTRR